MTPINTIEDLARILRDQPTWAEALRSLLLTQDLLDLPGRFDRFVETQEETNRLTDRRLNAIEGQVGNLQGGQYERSVRTKALARSRFTLGFEVPHVALNPDGLTDPRLNSAIDQAIRNGLVSRDGCADLFEADMIISGEDNRHAVVEVSLTADRDGIDRAKTRAGIMAAVTGGGVPTVVHHVEAEPNPIGPGGSGRSGRLRHTVPVSLTQAGCHRHGIAPMTDDGPQGCCGSWQGFQQCGEWGLYRRELSQPIPGRQRRHRERCRTRWAPGQEVGTGLPRWQVVPGWGRMYCIWVGSELRGSPSQNLTASPVGTGRCRSAG